MYIIPFGFCPHFQASVGLDGVASGLLFTLQGKGFSFMAWGRSGGGTLDLKGIEDVAFPLR